MDIQVPASLKVKMRRDWGVGNIICAEGAPIPISIKNVHQERIVRSKIARFVQKAIYPQQLTIPRQYSTTQEGVSIYKILEGRVIDGFQEQGVRVIVRENLEQTRFVISPLHASREDAMGWARQNMGLA